MSREKRDMMLTKKNSVYESSDYSDSEYSMQSDMSALEYRRDAARASRNERALLCCCIAGSLVAASVFASMFSLGMHASCGEEAGRVQPGWNEILPNQTLTAVEYTFFSVFWHQADVYDGNTTRIRKRGVWLDLKFFFYMNQKFSYMDMDTQQVRVVAETPLGLYMGRRFHIWTCAGSSAAYSIEEDYWARHGWNWQSARQFLIKDLSTGMVIAKSEHHRGGVFSVQGKKWRATVSSPDGDIIAGLVEDPDSHNTWFLGHKLYAKNDRPDIIPNEVVSFLSAAYDIQRQSTDSAT